MVVQFHITGHPAPNRYWLVLSTTGNEVCAETPGYPEDGQVTTDTATLARWCAGEISLAVAQRGGGMSVTAPTWFVKQLAGWGRLSPYAGTLRPPRSEASLQHGDGDPPRAVLTRT